MKRKLVFLGVMLGLGLADSAMAHVINVPVTVNAAPLTTTGFYPYGWADGARVKGALTFGGLPAWGTQAAEAASAFHLGDSHHIQNGGATVGVTPASTYVKLFTFTTDSSGGQYTVTVTDPTGAGQLDPAFSVYQGALQTGVHDNSSGDKLNAPDTTLAGEASAGTCPGHWPLNGLRITGDSGYDGQFNAFGSFSMAVTTAATRQTLTYVNSVAALQAKDCNGVSHGTLGNHGTTETLALPGLAANTTYTVIVGGERCVAYGATTSNPVAGYCLNEGPATKFSAATGTASFPATIQVTKP